MIDPHESFSSGSSFEACGDLVQTGEYENVNHVVLTVLTLQPHLEFANLFRRLFRLPDEKFMMHYVVYYRQVNKSCTGNYASPVAVLDVLSKVQELTAA